MQKVAFVSSPGPGHLNVLTPLWKNNECAHLFIVRFKDDLEDSAYESTLESNERCTEITWNQVKPSPIAKVFNEARCVALKDELKVRLYDYDPELIVYDFFCLEAQQLAIEMGIPAICSVPATLKKDERDTCSDGVLLKEHLYWIWRHPYEVAVSPAKFLGPRQMMEKEKIHKEKEGTEKEEIYSSWKNVIIVTFGTVIPRYPSCSEHLSAISAKLVKYMNTEESDQYSFLFAGLDGNENMSLNSIKEKTNVAFLPCCDLFNLMKEVDARLIIFHGGGNTMSEAQSLHIPVLICPFFGDQAETAKQAGVSATYTGDFSVDVPRAIDTYIEPVLKPLDVPFQDDFADFFRVGDLVFGQKKHRRALQLQFPQIDLHLVIFWIF